MKNKIAVIACIHGNEPYGLEVCKKLPASCSFFIANEKAIKKNKRFLDVDLNRCFPGKINGNNEERIAYELVQKLKNFDYVIDLHSTPHSCPLFGIITKPNNEKIKFAKLLGLKKLVIMNPLYASGRALIDFVKCGISLEVGPHDRIENSYEVLTAINSLLKKRNSKESEFEMYKVFSIIKGKILKILIKNFQKIKKGQPIAIKTDNSILTAPFDFIAILVGKKSYNDVLCLACKKL